MNEPFVDSLDAAWPELEAALPERWGFRIGSRGSDGWDGYRVTAFLTHAATESEMRYTAELTAAGDTPTAAVRALIAALRERAA